MNTVADLPTPPLTGGCHCKAIRYTIEADAVHLQPEELFGLFNMHPRIASQVNPSNPTALTFQTCAVHCNCTSCRTTTGNLWSTLLALARPGYSFTPDSIEPTTYNSSPTVTRTFCPKCGTHLTYDADGRGWMAIHVGSLDEPGRVCAGVHFHGQDLVEGYKRPDAMLPLYGYDGKGVYLMEDEKVGKKDV